MFILLLEMFERRKFVLTFIAILVIGAVTIAVLRIVTLRQVPETANTRIDLLNSSELFKKQRLSTLPGCFGPEYEVDLDENSVIVRALMSAKEKIPAGWELNGVCWDQSQETAVIISTSKVAGEKPNVPDETFSRTESLYPKLFTPPYTENGYYRLYRYYVYATYPTIISGKGGKLSLRANELSSVGKEIVWYEGLAGCRVEPGSYFRSSTFTVACGGGDNGCYEEERVQFTIFNDSTKNLGVCNKNCDLIGEQPSELTCE